MIRWYWLQSIISYKISIYIGLSSDSSTDNIVSISSSLIISTRVGFSSDSLPLSAWLRDSDSKSLYSNCAYVIISSVCFFENVAYGMYNTAGCIAIYSVYGCDAYTNAL